MCSYVGLICTCCVDTNNSLPFTSQATFANVVSNSGVHKLVTGCNDVPSVFCPSTMKDFMLCFKNCVKIGQSYVVVSEF